MPTYTMTGPDGRSYSIDGPPGASQAQVAAQMQAQFGQQAAAAPHQPAVPEELTPSYITNKFLAPAESFANAATFGAAPGIEAAIGSAASHVLPGENVTYQQALQAINAQHAKAVAQHPWLAGLGSVAGGVAPAVATGGATIPESLGVRAGGSLIGNGARILGAGALGGAEYGATAGAVQNLTGQRPGESIGQSVGFGGAEGGIEGAVGSAVGAGGIAAGRSIGKAIMGTVDDKAMTALAHMFQLPPSKVGAAISDLGRRLGKPASPAQAADLLTQGRIANAASKNPEIAAALQGAATQFDNSVPSLLGKTAGTPPELGPLTDARSANMTAAMDPIRDNPVPLTAQQKKFLQQPIITTALNARNRTATTAGIFDPSGNIVRPASLLSKIDKLGTAKEEPLTVDELDSLRETMGTEADSFGNPDNTAPDRRQRAADYRAVRGGVEDILSQPLPTDDNATLATRMQYASALQRYKDDSHFIRAYTAGAQGKYPQEIGDPELKASLVAPQGILGYEAGLSKHVANKVFGGTGSALSTASDLAQNTKFAGNVEATLPQGQALTTQARAALEASGALHSSAPGGAPRPNEALGANLGHLGAAAASHSVPGVAYRLSYLLPNGRYSPAVQRRVAQMLVDPKSAPKAVQWLSAQGIKDDAIRNLMNRTAPVAGALTASEAQ
jgi:hypothetical protein